MPVAISGYACDLMQDLYGDWECIDAECLRLSPQSDVLKIGNWKLDRVGIGSYQCLLSFRGIFEASVFLGSYRV
jgi:hypothetical protein